MFGGVELGGTKVMCVVGRGPGDITAVDRAPTTTPDDTLGWAVSQLRAYERRYGPLDAIGIASFGPLDLRPLAATFGQLLKTPKPKWTNVNVLRPFRQGFDVPVGIGSDVEGAALAERVAGAARDVDNVVYLTVGTGVGAGVIAGGVLVRGVVHPEVGHLAVPRLPGDHYVGGCPFHADCLEGMASGPAMAARWGQPAETLEGTLRQEALDLEAGYLAAGLRAMVYAFAPERVVLGGGVGLTAGLLPAVRRALGQSLAGYPGLPEYALPDFVVPAGLADLAGPGGALAFAAQAYNRPAV